MPNSILGICRKVLKVTDAEIDELKAVAKEQKAYLHPLKMGTAARQHALGEHNERVIAAVESLRTVLRSGESIHKG